MDDGNLRAALDALLARVDSTLSQTSEAFPYFADPTTGEWVTTDDGNWCGGHWVGLLWLAATHADGDDAARFEKAARAHTERMRSYMPRNSMFCGMNFHYAGFGGYDAGGDRSHYALGLEGADAMVAAYHEGARQIPLGELAIRGPEQFRGPTSDHGPKGDRIAAVDNVYTALPVLWRAFEETGNPIFRDVAVSHADRHLDWFLREDGSIWHHAVFDRETGELQRQYNELALSDETCWARGQGWNVAGLAVAYDASSSSRYLDALKRSVRFHRTYSLEDGVPLWDYEADEGEPRDTSAAALIAYGLLQLPRTDGTNSLRRYGRELLETLVTDYLVTDPEAPNYGAVLSGCFNRPGGYGDDNELLWTNYYVTATVARLLNYA